MRILSLGFGAVVLSLALVVTMPAEAAESGASGLPVPRFVTLKSDKVNARSGPGRQYPIAWVFQRKGMPVEIVAEFEQWRQVRDIDGAEGWVQQSLISGRRAAVIAGERRVLWSEPTESSIALALVEPGVIAAMSACKGDWCQVRLDGAKGWIRRGELWGVYRNEEFK
ncbi:MAG: hypothetical protein FJX47_06805 [Alphaproteobacteria bacterium]|nr:hypothetical protein [Alphaproteobacteria bacterium]